MIRNFFDATLAVAAGFRIFRPKFTTTLLLSGLIASFSQVSPAASLTKVSGIVPGYVASASMQRMPTADFDGDGLTDVVLLGSTNYSDVVQIAGFQTGLGWNIKQAIVPESPSYFYSLPTIATWTDADGAHLLYSRDNLLIMYSGWPLEVDQRFQLDSGIEFGDMRVADVDNDGVFEMIAVRKYSNQGLVAYSLATGTPIWNSPIQTSYYAKLHIDQVDADPALEIFLTGEPGTIVDGATLATEWVYKDGFGSLMEKGRFGGSSNRFASFDSNLLMFQSQPWSPLWDMLGIYATSSSVADIDGDEVDELIISSYSFPQGAKVIDLQTQSVRSSFDEGDLILVSANDFDGDSVVEIAMGLQADPSQVDASNFRVVDATSGINEFSLPAIAPGPYFAGGFIGDASSLDLVFGSGSMTDYPGVITRMDATTGAVRWRVSGDDPSVDLNRVRELQITNMVGHDLPVVLVSGTGYWSYYGQIAALDSSDGSLLWSLSSANGSIPNSAFSIGMASVDLDGDLLTDSILVCTNETRLRLFDTSTRAEIWSSVAMNGDCRGAMLMNSGGQKQLVAILTGALRAYDAQTHLLSWSLPFANGLLGAVYLPQGASGPELALFSNDSIAFHDAETRSLLRELNFPNEFSLKAIRQPDGASIHDLVISMQGRIHVLDGVSGEIRASSDALGLNAGQGNHLAVFTRPDGAALVGTGSEIAVFTHQLDGVADELFADGFDAVAP